MEQQTERGAADHGLLGATYLHQLYRAGTDLQATEVIQQACRAILLHAAGACPVDAHCDAAAALLVVCDEIFEWGPSTRTLPTANAVSRLPQALAVNVEPHLSRAERLSFHGLNVENAADRLAVRMYVDGPYWPRIEMHLCHPEFLDIPVYRTWLSLAQNLGRLTPMKADGWHPLLVVHSKVPEDSHTTLQLLSEISERTSLPLRASLENWLRELAAWNRSGNEANDAETAYFAGSDQPFDGSFHLDELARVIEGGLRGSFRPEE